MHFDLNKRAQALQCGEVVFLFIAITPSTVYFSLQWLCNFPSDVAAFATSNATLLNVSRIVLRVLITAHSGGLGMRRILPEYGTVDLRYHREGLYFVWTHRESAQRVGSVQRFKTVRASMTV